MLYRFYSYPVPTWNGAIMATGTGKVLCRYFMSGCCSKGEYCTFSHDWKDKPNMVCKYYLQGNCTYGSGCRYNHVRPRDKPSNEAVRTEKKTAVPVPAVLPSLSLGGSKTEFTNTAARQSQMVTLKKDPSKNPKKWVEATEFVPGKTFHGTSDERESEKVQPVSDSLQQPFSYKQMLSQGLANFVDVISSEEAASLLCPFAEMGQCPFGDSCEYLHGDVCDMCNRPCLSPFDPEQRKAHHKECLEAHERDMERSFQVQQSEEKKCSICLEHVTTKTCLSERRFGLLPGCEHCFCLSCIRKWRGSTHTQKKTIRACPLCRQVSYFIIPSEVWIEDSEEKKKLIGSYKDNLGKKHCKHFSMGKGTCPFGNKCFYKHEYPDGTKAVDLPRFYTDAEGQHKVRHNTMLWDFFNEREERQSHSSSGRLWDDDSDASSDDGFEGLPMFVAREIFGDRDWFWLTYEPDADELEDLL